MGAMKGGLDWSNFFFTDMYGNHKGWVVSVTQVDTEEWFPYAVWEIEYETFYDGRGTMTTMDLRTYVRSW